MKPVFNNCNIIFEKISEKNKKNFLNTIVLTKKKYNIAVETLIDYLLSDDNFLIKIKNACNMYKTNTILYEYTIDETFYVKELDEKFNIDTLLTGYHKNIINKFAKYNIVPALITLKDKINPFKLSVICYREKRKLEINWNSVRININNKFKLLSTYNVKKKQQLQDIKQSELKHSVQDIYNHINHGLKINNKKILPPISNNFKKVPIPPDKNIRKKNFLRTNKLYPIQMESNKSLNRVIANVKTKSLNRVITKHAINSDKKDESVNDRDITDKKDESVNDKDITDKKDESVNE